jgi:hypothetical protein
MEAAPVAPNSQGSKGTNAKDDRVGRTYANELLPVLLPAQPNPRPRPLLRHRQRYFYVAPGGLGVRADLVRVVHQCLRLLPL